MLCLLGAGGLALFVPWLTRLRWLFLIAGAVLLVVSLALNCARGARRCSAAAARATARARRVHDPARPRRRGARQRGVARATAPGGTSRRTSATAVSPQTVQVLKTLKTPVEAIAFFRSDTPGKRTAEDLLEPVRRRTRAASSRGASRTPTRRPASPAQYGVESYGTVVLGRQSPRARRTEKVLDAEEEKLTNALVKVTRAGKRVVYVLKGHGEREIGEHRAGGLQPGQGADGEGQLRGQGAPPGAQAAKVPDDAAVVIVPGPKTDLFPQELAALDAYIARGGKVFFMADAVPGRGPPRSTSTKYGIVLDDDVVIELNPDRPALRRRARSCRIVSQYEPAPDHQGHGRGHDAVPAHALGRRGQDPAEGRRRSSPSPRPARQSWGETDKAVFSRGQQAKPIPARRPGRSSLSPLVGHRRRRGQARGEGRGRRQPRSPEGAHRGRGHRRLRLEPVPRRPGQPRLLPQHRRPGSRRRRISCPCAPRTPSRTRSSLTSAQSNLVLWLPLVVLPGRRRDLRHRMVMRAAAAPASPPVARELEDPRRPARPRRRSRRLLLLRHLLARARTARRRSPSRGGSGPSSRRTSRRVTIKREGDTIRLKRVEGGWEMLEPVATRGRPRPPSTRWSRASPPPAWTARSTSNPAKLAEFGLDPAAAEVAHRGQGAAGAAHADGGRRRARPASGSTRGRAASPPS